MLHKKQSILGANINLLSWDQSIKQIVLWGKAHEHRYICLCNVHSVVTSRYDPDFKAVINQADLALPDGAPIAWALHRLGFPFQQRINGPDLMWRYLREAERIGQSVFFYGSTKITLRKLCRAVMHQFPLLQLVGSYSPPFRTLSEQEDAAVINMINHSGAQVIFVGLGCPKQEKWMAAHHTQINAVLIGVGAAFDYHAGIIKRAPLWWQNHGLEWLYRLASEPRRLFKRYIFTNTLFIVGFCRQWLAWFAQK